MHGTCFEELLDRAAAAVGYEDDPAGRGLCLIMKGMQTPSRASIAIEREGDGYVIRCATTEMGQGARRSLQLLAASGSAAARSRSGCPTRIPTGCRTTPGPRRAGRRS